MSPVLESLVGSALVITINRPHKRNAVDGSVTAGLASALARLEDEGSILVGVLTGAGDTFCVGADLRAGPAGERIVDEHGFGSLTRRQRTKPLIAAVEGPAYGGGFELALTCDMIVASRDARFGFPEVRRGVVAGNGLRTLAKETTSALATHMALTGEPIDGHRAHELGIVTSLADPGNALSSAMTVADRIMANAPLAVRESLHIIRDGVDLPADDARRLARAALKRLVRTADYVEGVAAFAEHRPPEWKGR